MTRAPGHDSEGIRLESDAPWSRTGRSRRCPGGSNGAGAYRRQKAKKLFKIVEGMEGRDEGDSRDEPLRQFGRCATGCGRRQLEGADDMPAHHHAAVRIAAAIRRGRVKGRRLKQIGSVPPFTARGVGWFRRYVRTYAGRSGSWFAAAFLTVKPRRQRRSISSGHRRLAA